MRNSNTGGKMPTGKKDTRLDLEVFRSSLADAYELNDTQICEYLNKAIELHIAGFPDTAQSLLNSAEPSVITAFAVWVDEFETFKRRMSDKAKRIKG